MVRHYLFIFFLAFCLTSQAQNTWDAIADFGGGQRERMVSFVVGSRAYVGTGQDTANIVKKDIWEYDPASNSWTQKANLPGSQRRDAIAFSIGTKGYVGTGINTAAALFGIKQKDFYEYNPVTNIWTAKANYPGNFNQGIYYAAAFATSTKGYVCCGKRGPSYYSAEVYEYNPNTNTWTKKADFPGGDRYGLSAFSIGDKGYAGLGTDENYYLSDFYVYDAAANHWDEIAAFPGSARFDAEGFAVSGRGFIAMGTDGGYKKDMYEYNPATDDWMQKADFPAPARRSCTAFSIGGYAYLGTGKAVTGTKRSFFKYTPYFLSPAEKISAVQYSSTVSPNPVMEKGRINISNGNEVMYASLSVFDENGHLRYGTDKLEDAGFTIDKNTLGAGVFFYKIQFTDGASSAGKIIII